MDHARADRARLIIGLLISRSQPELYKSSTMIQVLPQRVPDSFVKTTVTSTVEERLKSIEEVIKSRTAIETMITDLDLYPERIHTAAIEDLVADASSKLEIKVASTAPGSWRGPGPANSLRVSFTHQDKRKALQVTQRVTAMLLEENAQMRGSQANATSQFLERQLAEKRAELEEQERKVEAFRQRTPAGCRRSSPGTCRPCRRRRVRSRRSSTACNAIAIGSCTSSASTTTPRRS